jgi:hypothetical protein
MFHPVRQFRYHARSPVPRCAFEMPYHDGFPAPRFLGTALAFDWHRRVVVSLAEEVIHGITQRGSWSVAMKCKIGDVSRKRRLRGDTRALWYAMHRTTRFSRRFLATEWLEHNKAEARATVDDRK